MIETKNFTWNEITCNWKGNYGVNPMVDSEGNSVTWALEYNIDPTVKMLQKIREGVGKPIYINSSYRNPEYNKSIGGAKYSLHMSFKALDWHIKGYSHFDYLALATRIAAGEFFGDEKFGLGVYKTFLHLDCGPRRTWNG